VDGDGTGAGPVVAFCNNGSIPAGYAVAGTDCAPDDAARWKDMTATFVDRDGDGQTVAIPATAICTGTALPAPYFAKASGNDCDDTRTSLTHWAVLYPDHDGDGAGGGAYAIMCIGQTTPPGFSPFGDDENDGDPVIGPLDPEDILDLVVLHSFAD
jgi:hypothetical protein